MLCASLNKTLPSFQYECNNIIIHFSCLDVWAFVYLKILLKFSYFLQGVYLFIYFTAHGVSKIVMYMNLSLKQGIFNTHDAMNYKTSDSHSYLHYRSCHNPSTKNSRPIPFSQFLGCLCSDDANFAEKADEMTDFFNNRHNLIILMSLIKNVIYRACFANIIGLPVPFLCSNYKIIEQEMNKYLFSDIVTPFYLYRILTYFWIGSDDVIVILYS